MNIKSIKNEIRVAAASDSDLDQIALTEAVDAVVEMLSDMIYLEGKIADILIEHGKAKAKKNKYVGGSLCTGRRARKLDRK